MSRPHRSRAPGLVLALGLLVGCGGGVELAEGDGASSGSETSPSASAGEVGFTEVALISETAAGGRPGPAVLLETAADVRAFTRQFDHTRLTARVGEAAAEVDVPSDQQLLGAVLGVGCDEPSGVRAVVRSGEDWLLVPEPYAGPEKQCVAAVTTVALVLVDG